MRGCLRTRNCRKIGPAIRPRPQCSHEAPIDTRPISATAPRALVARPGDAFEQPRHDRRHGDDVAGEDDQRHLHRQLEQFPEAFDPIALGRDRILAGHGDDQREHHEREQARDDERVRHPAGAPSRRGVGGTGQHGRRRRKRPGRSSARQAHTIREWGLRGHQGRRVASRRRRRHQGRRDGVDRRVRQRPACPPSSSTR